MKVYTFDNKVLTHDSKWLKEAAAPVETSDYKLVMTESSYRGFRLRGFNPNVTSGSWNDTDLTETELTEINNPDDSLYYYCPGHVYGQFKPLTLIIANVSADTLTFKYGSGDIAEIAYTLYKTVGGTDTQIASGSIQTSYSSFQELTLNLT